MIYYKDNKKFNKQSFLKVYFMFLKDISKFEILLWEFYFLSLDLDHYFGQVVHLLDHLFVPHLACFYLFLELFYDVLLFFELVGMC